jgi:nucleotidyltransferase substrate binding protein (TIGR01987 family)
MIDVTPLTKASERLSEALREQALEPDRVLLRAGTIQTFEFTYELSFRILKRYLEANAANPNDIELLTFEGVIRLGDQSGLLLSPVAKWKDFRQARTDTSHTYNEEKAIKVLARIPDFDKEVKFLLERLRERSGVRG